MFPIGAKGSRAGYGVAGPLAAIPVYGCPQLPHDLPEPAADPRPAPRCHRLRADVLLERAGAPQGHVGQQKYCGFAAAGG